MAHLDVALPERTLRWLRDFGGEAVSQAATDADRVAEIVRMREREQKVLAGTWDQHQEADFLAFQAALNR